MNTTTLLAKRRFSIFVILFLLSIAVLTAQNKVVIKERLEIKPNINFYNQISDFTEQTVSHPRFILYNFWPSVLSVQANFPIVGYKLKFQYSLNVTYGHEDPPHNYNICLQQYPNGPKLDCVSITSGQATSLQGSALTGYYYGPGTSFISFGITKDGTLYDDPVGVSVNATCDEAYFNFSNNITNGNVVVTAENAWASLCPVVVLSKKVIKPGDTVTVSVMGRDTLGNLIPYPTRPPMTQDQAFDFNIISGTQYGMLSWLDVPVQDSVLTGQIPPILFIANSTTDADSVSAIIRARFYNYNDDWGTCGPAVDTITIKKEPLCPVVQLSKKNIYPGDTVFVSIVGKDQNNNEVSYPADQTFDVSIPEGAEYGILKSLSTGHTGTSLSNDKGPFLFITNETINVNSSDVVIQAWPSDGGGAAPLMKSGAKSEQQSLSAKTKISTRPLTANSSCEPPKKTLSLQNVTGLVLTTSPNSISCQQSLPIEIKAQGGGTIPDDAMVNVYTHGDDAEFGNIVNDSTGQSAKAMTVRYSNIRTGKVRFVPDCSHIQGRFPQGVRFGVNLAEKTELAAANAVIVKGPNTIGEYFSQHNPNWKDNDYDTEINADATTEKDSTIYCKIGGIGGKGCAMTCMAMVLKAFGCDVDPGKLNEWMKDNNGFNEENTGDVNFLETIFNYPASPVGTSLPQYKQPLNLDPLNYNLSLGYPSFVRIMHPGQHWVLVTGKTKSGQYTILDPNKITNVVLDPALVTKYYEVIPK
ncbi:MAG: C39 family peptidase [Bacteroidota bacterium]|jgi:hypothetical protein